MHVGHIIFSEFQGKYEKIKIICIYIYIYNFKTVVQKNLLRIICKKNNFKLTIENCKKFSLLRNKL